MMCAALLAACAPAAGDRAPNAADTGVPLAGMGADPDHALFACLVGDSAVYAAASDLGPGAPGGVRIHLWHAGDGVDGSATRPESDPAESVPLRVRLSGADALTIELPAGPVADDASRFEGRVTCDRLAGRLVVGRAPARPVTFRRVP